MVLLIFRGGALTGEGHLLEIASYNKVTALGEVPYAHTNLRRMYWKGKRMGMYELDLVLCLF